MNKLSKQKNQKMQTIYQTKKSEKIIKAHNERRKRLP